MGAVAPHGGEKKFRHNLQRKFVSAPQDLKCTPRQSKSQYLGHFCLVVLDRLLRATTKKGHQLF